MDLSTTPSSSRILHDVLCVVCRDHSSGKHYGVYACDGCAGFFKRSVRKQRSYLCKSQTSARCVVDKTHRNQCRACRMAKCIDVGMNRDAVQHERGPRNSTIRRQMSLYMNERSPPLDTSCPPVSIPPVPETIVPKQPLMPPPPPFIYPFAYSSLDVTNPLLYIPRPLPSPIPGLLLANDPGETCEAAAKLLFMNVKWAKSLPAFESLCIEDRLYLLGETWSDLFVIGAAQFLYPLDLKILKNYKNSKIDWNEVELLQATLADIVKLRPYNLEFVCLRGIMLFKTSPNDRLQDSGRVAAEYEKHKNILVECMALSYPLESLRSHQLLKLQPIIRRVSRDIIVDLFFRTTIGDIPLQRIICDMYRTA